MKLISKILQYNVKSNEQAGMWTEKILCDIIGINFNSKRDYINLTNYPTNLFTDLSMTLGPILTRLQIVSHIGNNNQNTDFLTRTGQHVSLKINTIGFKVCPQTIGQTTLRKLNEHFNTEFDKQQFKEFVMTDPLSVLNEYLKNTFVCEHTVYIKYNTGKVYYFHTTCVPSLTECDLAFTNTLLDWNESNTIKIEIDGMNVPLAEFQIHNNRNCIKCRFNFETVIKLIKSGKLCGVQIEDYDLEYKYDIKTRAGANAK